MQPKKMDNRNLPLIVCSHFCCACKSTAFIKKKTVSALCKAIIMEIKKNVFLSSVQNAVKQNNHINKHHKDCMLLVT